MCVGVGMSVHRRRCVGVVMCVRGRGCVGVVMCVRAWARACVGVGMCMCMWWTGNNQDGIRGKNRAAGKACFFYFETEFKPGLW